VISISGYVLFASLPGALSLLSIEKATVANIATVDYMLRDADKLKLLESPTDMLRLLNRWGSIDLIFSSMW